MLTVDDSPVSTSTTMTDFGTVSASYVEALRLLIDRLDLVAIERVANRLRTARDSGATVFVAGNGGSAATASHWVNDLSKATLRSGRAPIRVIGLVDNVAWLTALANDEGYERVFAGQLANLGRPGDVLVVISASGNSPNLVRAVELAMDREVLTIGFLGFDGGALKDMVDEIVWVQTPKGEYGLVESVHSIACDIVTTCLIEDRARSGPE